MHCALAPQVVEDDRAVDARCSEDVGLGWVVFDFYDGVEVPFELVDRLSSLVRPDLHELAGSGKLVLRWRVVNIA